MRPGDRSRISSVRIICPPGTDSALLQRGITFFCPFEGSGMNNYRTPESSEPLSAVAGLSMQLMTRMGYRHEAFRGPGWMQAIERVAAPLKLGGAELFPAVMKLCSAFTITSSAQHADSFQT